MAAAESPDSHEFRQMRNDVDDAYGVLTGMQETLGTVWAVQRRHGNRLDEIQQTLDLHSGRLDRMEDNQRRQADGLARIEETQNQQGERLGRIEETQGQQGDRLGRIEETQQQILELLRGRPTG